MNYKSKKIVMDALIKVINEAPNLYSQRNHMYNPVYLNRDGSMQEFNTSPNLYSQRNNMYYQAYQNRDVSRQEFETWIKYVNQILDISYDYIGFNDILLTKMEICKLASQHRLSNMQCIDQVNKKLITLVQMILQY